MNINDLRIKPLQSVQELISLLNGITAQYDLSAVKQEAWNRDVKTVEQIKSMLTNARSREEWRNVWDAVEHARRDFGGYVGDELGQVLSWSFDRLWHDIFESYAEVNKRSQR